MAEANDSIAVTPGTGATVATQLVNGKEYQAIILANPNGQVIGDIPTYSAWSGSLSSTGVFMHVFNATGSGKVVKMRKVFLQPSMTAISPTAIALWRVAKTSTVGSTSNVALSIRSHDSANPAVPSQITAGRSYTAGGTQSWTWFDYPVDTEETRSGIGLLPFMNILPVDGERTTDYVLNEGEGMAVQYVTTPGVTYSWSVLAVFSIE